MRKIILCLGILVMATASLNAGSDEQKSLENEKYKNILNQAEQLYSKEDMHKALDKMALEITEKLENKNPIFVCVLNGAIVPMGQLMTRLDFPLQIDYIHATRYGGKINGGDLKILAKPKSSFEDRVVVLVEDIIDTGKTLKSVIEYCYAQGAKEVLTASLVDKLGTRTEDGLEKVDFVGLEIPNKFIIGFGMDYEKYFRNLDGIYVMPENEIF
ncbi:MAG: hypothetical protein S4CHLAM6_02870 [Chlamydiae bacterium]|nr:hypothetical protein [Chlamydiota bacterium]